MPEVRKLFTALAGVALFAGIASAQVGTPTGGALGSGLNCGVTNGAVTPTLRAEGYTELVGDIVLVCQGGTALPAGTQIPTANIVVFVNTAVTSRLLPQTTQAQASEALLLVDEPGSGLTGYGPSVPITPCSSVNFGAGTGGCTEYVGNTGTGVGVPVTAPGGSTAGANVFQGVVSGNQVTFFGIPVQAPVTSGETRVYRITNIRANANGVTAGGPTPGAVTASLSISSSTSLVITNSTLTVGFVQQGLSPTGTLLRNSSNGGNLSSSGAAFVQCTSVSVTSTSTSSTTEAIGLLQFQENFGTAFKIRQSAANQSVPGTIYNSESGLIVPGVTGTAQGNGLTGVAGLADYGTRLKATFNNVPAGVQLYVTTRDVTNSFTIGTNTTYGASPQAVLVVSETAVDNGGAAGIPIAPPLASQTANFGVIFSGGTAVPYAPVVINSATGTGSAVWEIINTSPNAIDTVDFGLFANYTANAAANSPAPGSFSVTFSYAPTPSGGSFTSTTGPIASSSLTIPRFSDSLDITKNVATISLCTTAILFPYITNAPGFDTGFAVANTTSDIFGTAAQAGTCSLTFYGTNAPTAGGTGNPFVTPTVATGTVYANLASTLSPGFTGYMIANCNFQYGHGFAFISDPGTRNFAMGYLALVFTSSTSLNRGGSSEQLNN